MASEEQRACAGEQRGLLWAHGLEQLEGGHASQHIVAEKVLSEHFLI